VLVASGDSGSAGCDRFDGLTPEPAQNGLAVSGLASTPFNVAVGGTDFLNFGTNFKIDSPSPYWNPGNGQNEASAKNYIPESTWNSTCTNEGLVALGWEATAEARCNDPKLGVLLETLGGSGGRSNCTASTGFSPSDCSAGYPSPSWQKTGDNARAVPDVSLFASNGFLSSFYIVCEADVLPPIPPNASCNL
jgi:hypothetical protein